MSQPDDPYQKRPAPDQGQASAENPPAAPNQQDGQPAPGYPSAPNYQQAPDYQPGAQGYQPGTQPYGYGQVAPTNVPPGMYFDPASGLVIPNGTELASIGRRVGAFFLSIVLFIVTLVIGYVIWGLVVWGRGQTPALQVLGMRVWRPADNRPASFGYMALREIVGRFVEGILNIITGLISFVLMVSGKERRSIHDHIAGTVVLSDPHKVIRV